MRSYHLLNQLGRFHEVHLVIPQREVELRRGMEGCAVPQNIAVYSTVDRPSPGLFSICCRDGWAPRCITAGCGGAGAAAETTMLRAYHLLCEVLRRASINVVIFNEIATMQAAPLVARIAPRLSHRGHAQCQPPSSPQDAARGWRPAAKTVGVEEGMPAASGGGAESRQIGKGIFRLFGRRPPAAGVVQRD